MRQVLLCLCILLLALLTACRTDENNQLPDLGDGGFLTGDPCAPPCSWNIRPGETNEAGAKEILQIMGIAEYCMPFNSEAESGTRGISCDSTFGVSFAEGSDIVASIGIKPSQQIAMADVIVVYGNPDAVLVTLQGTPEEKQQISMIVYYDSIFTRLVLPDQDGSLFEVGPTTPVENIGYSDANSFIFSPQYSSPWIGYGQYEPNRR